MISYSPIGVICKESLETLNLETLEEQKSLKRFFYMQGYWESDCFVAALFLLRKEANRRTENSLAQQKVGSTLLM